jgi:phenylacetate-CoA ligase
MVDARFRDSITAAENARREPGVPLPFARFRKHQLVKNTSSGSTGAPTVFYEDGSRSALNWAYELRLKNWYGIKPGAREARMVRISTDYAPKSRANLVRRKLWGQLILPGVNLSDNDYELCVKSIVEFRPKVLWGFTSALAGLAEYILKNKGCLGLYRPEMVTGWAAPVYEHEEMVLKKAFGCPVTNLYSAREVGHIAGKCPHGYFHINQENLLVESEKTEPYETFDKGTGEILVTNLDISPMPFIRYRMGDIGRLSRFRCSCGRTLQVIEDLLGRTGEIFITKDGRMISPNFWCRTFMSGNISGAVNRFQIIYTRNKDIRILLVRDKRYSADTENYIRETVEKNFSANTRLFLEYVPNIEPQVSGKYQMVIHEGNTH